LISLNYSPPWLRFGAFAKFPSLANRHARLGRAARIAAVGVTFGCAAWIFDWASDFGYCGRAHA
jgi:hypothetical protein